jgi:hypothetical protein
LDAVDPTSINPSFNLDPTPLGAVLEYDDIGAVLEYGDIGAVLEYDDIGAVLEYDDIGAVTPYSPPRLVLFFRERCFLALVLGIYIITKEII